MDVQENQPQMRSSRYSTRSSTNNMVVKNNNNNGNRRALGDISNKNFTSSTMQHGEKKSFVKKHITRSITKQRNALMDVEGGEQPSIQTRASKRKSTEISMDQSSRMEMAQQQQQPNGMDVDDDENDFNVNHEEERLPQAQTIRDFAFIDEEHADNALHMPEYVNAMFALNKKAELKKRPNVNYMSRQAEINYKMREILIDWLVEVHVKFKLVPETLYLTVNLIDRFLDRRQVSRTKLQLVGCAAMLLACKYEEIYAPEVRDFVYISDRTYTREQILAMETIMLNTLHFKLCSPSALKFGNRLIKVAGKYHDQTFQHMVHFILETTLQEYHLLKHLPSQIASAAVFLALAYSEGTGQHAWNDVLASYTKYEFAEIRECVSDMFQVLRLAKGRHLAVRKKYANAKFDCVGTNNFADMQLNLE